MSTKTIIGRYEHARFPELKIGLVQVKIDTGARSSSIHATDIEEFERDGEAWVKFNFVDDQHEGKKKHSEAPLWMEKYVRSSNGKKQKRYFIQTKIKFGNNKVYPIKISLTDRGKMRYPVLIGRRLLAKRFLVDVEKSYALGNEVH